VQLLDIIKVFFYSPTDALVRCLKKTILKFTLKQLPTCFGVTVTNIIRELTSVLMEVLM